MLSERPTMRTSYPRENTSVLTWLLCSLIAGLVVQFGASAAWPGGGAVLTDKFALSDAALRTGQWWTLFTHSFLHDPRYLFHGLGSLLMIYFFGRELLPLLGARRFVSFYFGATILGSLTWWAAHWHGDGVHLGAMAAADGMLILFACLYPNRRIDFLALFIPVSFKPKHLAWMVVGLALVGLLFFELRGGVQPFGNFAIASSAHLGGMLAGWLYYRFVHETQWRRTPRLRPLPATPRRAVKADEDEEPAAPPPERKEDLRARVDRVLDKINSQGFGSLTAEEKKLLADAKDRLKRH